MATVVPISSNENNFETIQNILYSPEVTVNPGEFLELPSLANDKPIKISQNKISSRAIDFIEKKKRQLENEVERLKIKNSISNSTFFEILHDKKKQSEKQKCSVILGFTLRELSPTELTKFVLDATKTFFIIDGISCGSIAAIIGFKVGDVIVGMYNSDNIVKELLNYDDDEALYNLKGNMIYNDKTILYISLKVLRFDDKLNASYVDYITPLIENADSNTLYHGRRFIFPYETNPNNTIIRFGSLYFKKYIYGLTDFEQVGGGRERRAIGPSAANRAAQAAAAAAAAPAAIPIAPPSPPLPVPVPRHLPGPVTQQTGQPQLHAEPASAESGQAAQVQANLLAPAAEAQQLSGNTTVPVASILAVPGNQSQVLAQQPVSLQTGQMGINAVPVSQVQANVQSLDTLPPVMTLAPVGQAQASVLSQQTGPAALRAAGPASAESGQQQELTESLAAPAGDAQALSGNQAAQVQADLLAPGNRAQQLSGNTTVPVASILAVPGSQSQVLAQQPVSLQTGQMGINAVPVSQVQANVQSQNTLPPVMTLAPVGQAQASVLSQQTGPAALRAGPASAESGQQQELTESLAAPAGEAQTLSGNQAAQIQANLLAPGNRAQFLQASVLSQETGQPRLQQGPVSEISKLYIGILGLPIINDVPKQRILLMNLYFNQIFNTLLLNNTLKKKHEKNSTSKFVNLTITSKYKNIKADKTFSLPEFTPPPKYDKNYSKIISKVNSLLDQDKLINLSVCPDDDQVYTNAAQGGGENENKNNHSKNLIKRRKQKTIKKKIRNIKNKNSLKYKIKNRINKKIKKCVKKRIKNNIKQQKQEKQQKKQQENKYRIKKLLESKIHEKINKLKLNKTKNWSKNKNNRRKYTRKNY